ncbi:MULTISPECIES: glutaredoxin 3 [Rubrivivax]|uniref:Glutaredoxin n=1 Tax=Rubrivivax benzoatilyticus TaxID=316997 RepID=A0ABX0HVR6_9BURK|nr:MULTISPECIES: glutaredoxin 3 [Rubrivivax]MCD0420770.1 glutaredoxin 3 [Rubrivivax sp. JA1024]EGJ08701.1 glutaredoxin 3 [Rubrivivax benzoatilyticus JA2 = ATCC BAA-35]MCC9595544.1 glutaredoxin 3 [Rubrivivax sp. JA1055]MCC9646949.1 glutaredoxin 3 [Rubrivivax sp. JA1029]NHK97879.1 glutaredoxin 3 [Rubrivivax benzoatilyticus]
MSSVRMYTTQVCPYCLRAKALLKQRGVEAIEEIRVDLDPAQRDTMIALTGRRTVPQIFIGETHVGGCDDLIALDQRGGLAPLLAG